MLIISEKIGNPNKEIVTIKNKQIKILEKIKISKIKIH